jgi:uncharacterized membrane protein YdbT with pleckstrin-like domain
MGPQMDYPLNNIDAPQNVQNPLAVMQPGERVLCEIRRHPFGLFGLYAMAIMVGVITLGVAIALPYYASFLTTQQKIGIELAAALVLVVMALISWIGVFVYKANRWIVTSDSITQVVQTGLFNTRSSQMSLANLEDVSARQDGIIQEMLGYGVLTVETAGERSKFVFNFCPNPNEYARKIIAAHEEYIANRPSEMQVTNRPLAATQNFNQPGPAAPSA